MFVQTEPFTLTLTCKDCRRPVTDSETNAYRLIKGVLYGWCDACFNNRHSQSTHSAQKNEAMPEPARQTTSAGPCS
jgi:hypothetical protein